LQAVLRGSNNMVKKVNLQKTVDSSLELFKYIGIGKLNDHILNVLKAENRTLNFHVHEKSDELFYVIEGRFEIELDNGIIEMEQGDLIIIPKGIRHRPVCKSLVKCLLIELDGTLNKENTGGKYNG
jgi:mannose-6-phosphate isomerase-like protein (cupin superfamily)